MFSFKTIITSFIFVTLISTALSQNIKDGLALDINLTNDVVTHNNINRFSNESYLGMIDASFELNTQQSKLWRNGIFHFQMQHTYGGRPSANIINDIQCFSNIENGNYLYLYQIWYQHSFYKFSILAGVHDLNSKFLTSEYTGSFINSSFGIMPVVSLNVPVSIFPKNTLGLVVDYQFSENMSIQYGLYDGNPDDLDKDPYCTDISLNIEEGLFNILEIAFNPKILNYNSYFKVGSFYHSGKYQNLEDTLKYHDGDYGFYFIIDQPLTTFRSNKGELGVFAQAGYAPSNRNMIDMYWSLGVNVKGALLKRSDDILAIGIASASIGKEYINTTPLKYDKNETIIECLYTANINKHFFIQPEFQYIINPGGLSDNQDVFVGLVRSQIYF